MKPRIQVAAGPLADSIYFLTEPEVRIGRDPSNSLAISDLSLSRRHCVLAREEDGYKLHDLDSRNGTFVNGRVVSEKQLNHGDQITVRYIPAVNGSPLGFLKSVVMPDGREIKISAGNPND